MRHLFLSSRMIAGFALVAALAAAPARAAIVFTLTATDVSITQPAPLFTSSSVSGTLTLADSVTPGASFGAAGLIGVALNFGGIKGTLADVQADVAPGPVQIFGTRSLDGSSFSMLDFRFGFQPTDAGCSFVCAGQILINSTSDPSNFIALDDFAGDTLSVIDSFTPRFTAAGVVPVPEPSTAVLLMAACGIGLVLPRRAAAARRLAGRSIRSARLGTMPAA